MVCPIFGANNTTFAGVSASAVNVQRDGVTVNDVRFPTGINSAARVNPDLVGEFRMVLAPVDAEVGRGNAQVQIATRSGTNDYHGNAVWSVQNTALDPNTWNDNRLGNVPPWRNLQEYTISAGGPIIKNKTFFFALYNGQVAKRREPYNAMSLTPRARQGIFRFWDRWNNRNILTTETTSAAGSTSGNFCGLYGNCTPDLVNGGIDPSSVGVSWPGGDRNGRHFANRYTFTRDPQCNNIASNLRSLCTLQAIVDSTNGNIVMQNPLPGKIGTLGYNTFRNLLRWNVDMSLSKSVEVYETKSFSFRVDISNIFNHPFASGTLGASGTRITFPTAPCMNINGGTPIGQYSYKVGGRTLQAMVRFDF